MDRDFPAWHTMPRLPPRVHLWVGFLYGGEQEHPLLFRNPPDALGVLVDHIRELRNLRERMPPLLGKITHSRRILWIAHLQMGIQSLAVHGDLKGEKVA
eukprot:2402309-Amphidinium_carterae.1